MKQDIWIKILKDKRDSLLEIPGFMCREIYDGIERGLYPSKEIGKIVTKNYNFRFCQEDFKIEKE